MLSLHFILLNKLWQFSCLLPVHSFKNRNYQIESSMKGSSRSYSPTSKKVKKQELGVSFKPENFIPGIIIGFIVGLLFDLSKPRGKKIGGSSLGQNPQSRILSSNSDEELKMVLVVRQDLKMGTGKIASQCAHAATGLYSELMERNKLKDAAESIGLPTFTVADAGRTQVSAGSKTVLAIGPGNKSAVDSITGKLRLL